MQHVESLFETRLSRRTTIKGALAAGVGGALAAHGLGTVAHRRQAEADYPEIVVVATEYAFDIPASIQGGWTRITLDNQNAAMDHHVMFMRVNDDAPLADLEAALLEPAFEPMFAVSTSLGGPFAAPGGRGSVIVDLVPGTYVLICVIPDADGVPHYALGMQAVLDVTEPAESGEAPDSAATVELMEMMFHNLPAEVAAGPQVWRVDNIGGAIHELAILQLAPGITAEAAQEMLLSPPEAPAMDHATPLAGEVPEAPFFLAGGAAPMSPRQTNFVELDFVPADYLAVCFVPDGEGVPHLVLGMVMPFTVA